MEAAQVPINRWVETTVGHLHNEILLSHEKKKFLLFVTVWMDPENTMQNKLASQRKTNTT